MFGRVRPHQGPKHTHYIRQLMVCEMIFVDLRLNLLQYLWIFVTLGSHWVTLEPLWVTLGHFRVTLGPLVRPRAAKRSFTRGFSLKKKERPTTTKHQGATKEAPGSHRVPHFRDQLPPVPLKEDLKD